LPIVLSTVNVKTGANQPTIHELADVLDGIEALDRTTINGADWSPRRRQKPCYEGFLIGAPGFEPGTSCPRQQAATRSTS
jgi:hypothetical protein